MSHRLVHAVKRLRTEPLLHFLLLGTALFVVFEILDRPDDRKGGQIIVTTGTIEHLRAAFSRVWQRPPSAEELDGLIADYVREEVLAREAVALGLDRDDTVIRRRLRQKMEFIANDLAAQAEPSDEDLREHLAQHPDLFRLEPRLTFRQVYLNPQHRGDGVEQDAAQLLAALHLAGIQAEFDAMGDSTLLSPELIDARASEVAGMFGEPFARQLLQLPLGQWQGPLASGYGVHLVYVSERMDGRIPPLAEVRDAVHREWANARRLEANETFYRTLRQRYAVTVERPPSAGEAKSVATVRR
jgi:PPIC-type PPIASE domain